MKNIIKQCKEDHYNANPNEYANSEYNPSDRRVLVTYQVAKAQKILYKQHKDTIINTFRNLGLSLNPNGSEDSQLKIQDILDITIGEWKLLEEDTIIIDSQAPSTHATNLDFQNPIAPFTIELRTRSQTTSTRKDLYYTHKEIEEGISDREDDENDITTDSGDDTEARFDSDDDKEFDPEYDIQDVQDMNIRG